MRDENINDPLREKLNSLEEVPNGFHFNHSAVWQKLEVQLQMKNKRKNRFVFLYAASFVWITLIFSLYYYSSPKPAKTTSEADLRKMTNAGKSPATTERNKNILPLSVNEPAANPSTQKQLQSKIQKQSTISIQQVQKTNAVEFTKLINTASNESTQQIPVEIVTVPETGARKPRFKIAHINEVNRSTVQVDLPQTEKNNYGFTLRKEVSFSSLDEKFQSFTSPINKQKTLVNLITSQ